MDKRMGTAQKQQRPRSQTPADADGLLALLPGGNDIDMEEILPAITRPVPEHQILDKDAQHLVLNIATLARAITDPKKSHEIHNHIKSVLGLHSNSKNAIGGPTALIYSLASRCLELDTESIMNDFEYMLSSLFFAMEVQM